MKWFLLITIFYGPSKPVKFQIQQPSEKACYEARNIMYRQVNASTVNSALCVPGESVALLIQGEA